jgi:GNAT superfamily N-acetyltransferase
MSDAIFAALEATWPAARCLTAGGWTIREGLAGGQRVSAATGAGDVTEAEAAMRRLGQDPIFMLRAGDTDLDQALAARGYLHHDPVVIYAARCETLANPAPDPMRGFPHWPPLAIVTDLWAQGGIGAGRLAVMARAPGPKVALLGRCGDRPAGVAFVAVDQRIAAIHAVEVAPDHRRQGVGRALLQQAALWATGHGADQLVLAVTRGNVPARALYAGLGMDEVGQYHYRIQKAGSAGN